MPARADSRLLARFDARIEITHGHWNVGTLVKSASASTIGSWQLSSSRYHCKAALLAPQVAKLSSARAFARPP